MTAGLNKAWACAACNAANVDVVLVGGILEGAVETVATEVEVCVLRCPMRSSLLLNLLPHTSPLFVQLHTKGAEGVVVEVGGVPKFGGKSILAGGGTPIINAENAAPAGHDGSVQ